MKRNFVFVVAIFALTAFTIGVVSITQQLNAQQTMPNKKKVDDTAKDESKSSDEEIEDQQKKIEKIRELIKKLQTMTDGDFEKLLKLRDTSSKGATTTIKDVTGRTITYTSDGKGKIGNEGWKITVSPEEKEKLTFEQLGIPEWWMNPPEFANHIVFGRGVSCFEELDELQDAMNAAQLSARYEIGAKLGGRMNVKTNSENLEIQESGYLQTNNLREYKNEIVKTEEGYAYYVIYTYSLYNQALLRNDPTMIPKIKETLRMLEEHGAFNHESNKKNDEKQKLQGAFKQQDNVNREMKEIPKLDKAFTPKFKDATNASGEKKLKLDSPTNSEAPTSTPQITKPKTRLIIVSAGRAWFNDDVDKGAMRDTAMRSALHVLTSRCKEITLSILTNFAEESDRTLLLERYWKNINTTKLFDFKEENVSIFSESYENLTDHTSIIKIRVSITEEELRNKIQSFLKECDAKFSAKEIKTLEEVTVKNLNSRKE